MQTYNLEDSYIVTPTESAAITTENIEVSYGSHQVIYQTNLQFPRNKISALIGASGSGKSTLLRSFNRMNDGKSNVNGQIWYRDVDINDRKINIYELRKHIGMVFQRPNPFAKSIKDNLTFALKENGITDKQQLSQRMEESLTAVSLWDEVKDKINESALSLSGGQAQRLCIARSIAMKPDVLLLDEPASALDPISSAKLEETLKTLSENYTIIIVTHNMQQASRVSDYTAFLHMGHVIEYDLTENIFTNPHIQTTEDYISGNFG